MLSTCASADWRPIAWRSAVCPFFGLCPDSGRLFYLSRVVRSKTDPDGCSECSPTSATWSASATLCARDSARSRAILPFDDRRPVRFGNAIAMPRAQFEDQLTAMPRRLLRLTSIRD